MMMLSPVGQEMNEMLKNITLDIKGQDVALTLDEMRELRNLLNALIGDAGELKTVEYVPIPYPSLPPAPWNPSPLPWTQPYYQEPWIWTGTYTDTSGKGKVNQ